MARDHIYLRLRLPRSLEVIPCQALVSSSFAAPARRL